MSPLVLVLIGTSFHFLGASVYLINTLRGITKPNRVTFILWAVFPLIGVAAGFSEGPTWTLLPVFMAGIWPLLVFFASFVNPKAYWKLETLDYVCGFLAVLAIAAWLVTKQPMIATLLALVADWLAGLPTLIKSWRFPETETGTGYALAFLNAVFGFFALRSFGFSETIWIIYLMGVNLALAFFVYRKHPLQKLRKEFAWLKL